MPPKIATVSCDCEDIIFVAQCDGAKRYIAYLPLCYSPVLTVYLGMMSAQAVD
jgi:hypothetical protein